MEYIDVMSNEDKTKRIISYFMHGVEVDEVPTSDKRFLAVYGTILEEFAHFELSYRNQIHDFVAAAYEEGFVSRDAIIEYLKLPRAGLNQDSAEIISSLLKADFDILTVKKTFISKWISVEKVVEYFFEEKSD